MATEQTKVGEVGAARGAELLEQVEYQRTEALLERAEAAQREQLPATDPKATQPLDDTEFQELGKSIDGLDKLDPQAAELAAERAGRLARERREPPMDNEAGRRAFLEAQVTAMDQRALDARKIEEYERRLDAESDRTASAKDARQEAELQAIDSQFAQEAERLPAAEREGFRREHGLDVERAASVDVAANLDIAADRDLALSDAAKAQFDRYQHKEIEYKDIQGTDDLAEGYEINRLVAHARIQQAAVEKGELSQAALDADEEAQRGRDLDESLERARARRVEQDEERGEIEPDNKGKRERDGDNSIEDFEAGADAQARQQVPDDVDRNFPSRTAGKARTHYYAQDADRVAWVDKGNKLKSPRSFDQQGVRAMVDVAKARGWDEVKVRGSEAFRRQAYIEAANRGIKVKGYTPSEAEKERADKALGKYRENQQAADAFAKAKDREAKAEATQKHPHLAKAYKMEAAARAFAKQHKMSPDAQQNFVSRVRDTIERDLRDGKTLPNVEVRRRQKERQAEAEQSR